MCKSLLVISQSYHKQLSEISQAWANNLLDRGIKSFAESGKVVYFEHNYDKLRELRIGENLYYSVNYDAIVKPSLPVRLWYEEIEHYDFSTGDRKITSHPESMIGGYGKQQCFHFEGNNA